MELSCGLVISFTLYVSISYQALLVGFSTLYLYIWHLAPVNFNCLTLDFNTINVSYASLKNVLFKSLYDNEAHFKYIVVYVLLVVLIVNLVLSLVVNKRLACSSTS